MRGMGREHDDERFDASDYEGLVKPSGTPAPQVEAPPPDPEKPPQGTPEER